MRGKELANQTVVNWWVEDKSAQFPGLRAGLGIGCGDHTQHPSFGSKQVPVMRIAVAQYIRLEVTPQLHSQCPEARNVAVLEGKLRGNARGT